LKLRSLFVIAGTCLVVATGAYAAVVAATPPGEPTIPGVEYAVGGIGAKPLPTTGAPRHLTGAGIGQLGGALQAAATKAGTAAGKAAGTGKLPALKVGFVDIIGGIESADRVDNAWRNAFQHLGAKWLYCDGAGNPSKWATCGTSLLSQGANVLTMNGIDPTTIPQVMKAAARKHVPIISCCGAATPGFAVNFAPDEKSGATILAKWLQAKVKGRSGVQKIVAIDYPATWATSRTKVLKALVASDPHLQVIATAVTDPTNLVEGTRKIVDDELTAHPDVAIFWASFDTVGQVVGQEVAAKFPGKSWPEKPLVATFHADPSTLPLLKSGAINGVVDYNYDVNAWESVDAFVQNRIHGTAYPPFAKTNAGIASYPGIGNPLYYPMVVGANVPPAGQYVRPKVDAVSYFIAKWKAEGIGK